MKRYNGLCIFALFMLTSAAWAYGGGGDSSSKSCDKPKFSQFVPAENAEVKAGSAFSFTASKNTYPTTIKVTVKDRPAEFTSSPKSDGTFEIRGTIPSTLKATYARIAISADAQSNCKGSGGWLVKIID
ncbi:MAG: hypothetical protein ABL933_14970 [Methyloglobulus sp.]|nr:hypothetical protein [Methyloglobulus sp.]